VVLESLIHSLAYAAAEILENSTSVVTNSMATNCEMTTPLLNSSAASKILVIGATGYIGRFVVQAAVAAGHPTYAFIRPPTASNPAKEQLVRELKDSGAQILYVYDHLIIPLYKLFAAISLFRFL